MSAGSNVDTCAAVYIHVCRAVHDIRIPIHDVGVLAHDVRVSAGCIRDSAADVGGLLTFVLTLPLCIGSA
jgi:hypothetical protein